MDIDAQQEREHARQVAIENAVAAADRVVMGNSDGSAEMTNGLTAEVARYLLNDAIEPLVDPLHIEVDGIVYMAILAADQALCAGRTEDSVAVRNSLRFRVAMRFVEKVGIVFDSALLIWNLECDLDPDTTE